MFVFCFVLDVFALGFVRLFGYVLYLRMRFVLGVLWFGGFVCFDLLCATFATLRVFRCLFDLVVLLCLLLLLVFYVCLRFVDLVFWL